MARYVWQARLGARRRPFGGWYVLEMRRRSNPSAEPYILNFRREAARREAAEAKLLLVRRLLLMREGASERYEALIRQGNERHR